MKSVLIIEDEKPAAERLINMLQGLDPEIEILAVIDSIEDAVLYLNSTNPDIAFMDIQLADGLSFSIFDQVEISFPVIFSTAYDEYAIRAFKVHSIDYLLKPLDGKELKNAWSRYLDSFTNKHDAIDVQALMETLHPKKFKERFLIKMGDQFKYITADQIAYFYSEESLTFLIDKNANRMIIDEKMDQLEAGLNPSHFYRINRKFVIAESAILKISNHFNSRLKLQLKPQAEGEVIVARERVPLFKKWLNQ